MIFLSRYFFFSSRRRHTISKRDWSSDVCSSDLALKNINMSIRDKEVTAIIGPSGCGKSTYLKTLNRMVELIPTVRMEGEIAYKGKNILDKTFRSEELRT